MLKVLSLFSGIGAFEKALENLNIEHEILAYCEIDKYASKAYSVIHDIPESKNLKDVTKVDILDVDEQVDFICYGFPCQDISNAGKQKGFTDEEGNRTRSGLFFEAARIIDDYKPKFAIAENVKALTSKKFTEEFKTVLDTLDEIGYNNYHAILNAKDFGIPQNRDRVFIISIRKDIDKGFDFPEPFPLELRLKDLLEDNVPESFYLSDDIVNKLVYKDDNKEDQQVLKVGNVNPSGKGQNGTVIDSKGLARTITLEKGEGQKVLIRKATKSGYAEAYPGDTVSVRYLGSKTRRGRVGKNGVANTLTCQDEQGVIVDDIDEFLNS